MNLVLQRVNDNWLRRMRWLATARQQAFCLLRYYPRIYVEKLWEVTKAWAGQDSKQAPQHCVYVCMWCALCKGTAAGDRNSTSFWSSGLSGWTEYRAPLIDLGGELWLLINSCKDHIFLKYKCVMAIVRNMNHLIVTHVAMSTASNLLSWETANCLKFMWIILSLKRARCVTSRWDRLCKWDDTFFPSYWICLRSSNMAFDLFDSYFM
jgi:hypothetical protein